MFKKSTLLISVVLVCGLSLMTETKADDLWLVGWWKLDEGTGTLVTDSSGNGITGHFTGHPVWAEGFHGGALWFDGASSVDFGNPPETAITGPLSITCWIKPSNLGTALGVAGQVGDDESSCLSLTQEVPDGILTFWYKVSSEGSYDHLEFAIDGIAQERWSGERDWQAVSFPVNAGLRTFTWTYVKDSSSSSGADSAWIDDVVLP